MKMRAQPFDDCRATPAPVRRAALLLALLGAICGPVAAQSMLGQIRADISSGWRTYLFVSTGMPRARLVELAREASATDAVLVLRGFAAPSPGGVSDPAVLDAPIKLQTLQTLVAEVDAACCQGHKVAWMVDPKLFDRYRITAAPSFCIAWGDAGAPQDYSVVSGDMALANALKFMAQQSARPGIRKRAASIYQGAFGGRS